MGRASRVPPKDAAVRAARQRSATTTAVSCDLRHCENTLRLRLEKNNKSLNNKGYSCTYKAFTKILSVLAVLSAQDRTIENRKLTPHNHVQ